MVADLSYNTISSSIITLNQYHSYPGTECVIPAVLQTKLTRVEVVYRNSKENANSFHRLHVL